MKLTLRQFEVLCSVISSGVRTTDHDGSVLEALRRKGLVNQIQLNYPGYVTHSWSASQFGKDLAIQQQSIQIS